MMLITEINSKKIFNIVVELNIMIFSNKICIVAVKLV